MSYNLLSQSTLKLIARYKEWQAWLMGQKSEAAISVDEVASSVTTFYEKIKGVVDWREEHLLRKRAIERTLKRLIVFEDGGEADVAQVLIHELIRGGYFPNNVIEEAKILSVKKIMDKYFYILKNTNHKNEKEKILFENWLIKIASYEIEKNLAPALKEDTLMKFMTNEMIKSIKLHQEGITAKISEEEKNVQIYIATQRALFKIDRATIAYNLLERKYPNWSLLTEKTPELQDVARNIQTIKQELDRDLNHPLASKFHRVCERYDTPFLILSDIVASDPMLAEQRLRNPLLIEGDVTKFYNIRMAYLQGVMRRAAIYSTLSIFITKVFLALLTEIPFDIFVTGQFHYGVLMINLLFPPVLMYILVASARLPGPKNLQQVIEEVKKIINSGSELDVHEIRITSPKNKFLQSTVVVVYIFTYVLTFGVVIYVLRKLDFSIFSIGIFIVFLSTISFLGIKIRERSKELNVEADKETIWQTIVIFFFFPIIRAGKWLIDRWSGLEITLLITIVIDMPFLVFIGFIEQWRHFLREKREEIK